MHSNNAWPWLVPLESLNDLPGIAAIPRSNSDDELDVPPAQAANTELGLLVGGFQQTIGVLERDVAMSMRSAKFGMHFAGRIGLFAMRGPRS